MSQVSMLENTGFNRPYPHSREQAAGRITVLGFDRTEEPRLLDQPAFLQLQSAVWGPDVPAMASCDSGMPPLSYAEERHT